MNGPADWALAVAAEVERALDARREGPATTYRLQFDPEHLTFRDAAGLVPYLDALGVSHVYASPYVQNRSGCAHGYAVVDYEQINPALGDASDYEAMVRALGERGMGQVLDIVPNHMAASAEENAWWRNVLENGPSSPYAEFFDIDWRPVKEELRGKVLLPVLGGQFGRVLESGELKIEYDQGVFERTHELVFRLLVEEKIDGVRIDHIDGLYDPREYLWRLQWGLLRALAKAAHARLAEGRGGPAAGPAAPAWELVETDVLRALWRSRGGAAPERVFPRLAQPGEDPPAQGPGGAPPAPAGQAPLYVVVEKILGPEEPLPPDWPCAGTTGYDFMNSVHGLFVDPAGLGELGRFYRRFQQVTSPVTAKGIEDTAFYRYFPLASANEVGGEPLRAATSVEDFHRENLARRAGWPRSMVSTSSHDTKRSEDVRARISVLSEVPQLWRSAVYRWAAINRRHHRKIDGRPAPTRNDEYLFYQTLVGAWPIGPEGPAGHEDLVRRMADYMEKATREAKVHTSWISPDPEYDEAVRGFVEAALRDAPGNRFLADFRQFHEKVVHWGLYTALSQVFLKIVSPGVPDVYQGQELWDFSLVDPDNRRPVDFARRRELLAEIAGRAESGGPERLALARDLARRPRDPRLKLLLTWTALRFRRDHDDLFRRGDYVPLAAEGARAGHVCAFAWRLASPPGDRAQVAVAVAPRWLARLTPLPEDGSPPPPPLGPEVWGDTRIVLGDVAGRTLHNLFTGQECPVDASRLDVAAALADFPAALMVGDA